MKIDSNKLVARIERLLEEATSYGSRGFYTEAAELHREADTLMSVVLDEINLTFTRETRPHYRLSVIKEHIRKINAGFEGSAEQWLESLEPKTPSQINEIRYQAIMGASKSTELSSYVQNTLVCIANRVRTGGDV